MINEPLLNFADVMKSLCRCYQILDVAAKARLMGDSVAGATSMADSVATARVK